MTINIRIIFLIILFFGVFFFKNRLLVFYTKVKKLFNIKNIIKEIGCILFFCFWAIYTSFLYIIILHQILGLRLNLQDIRVISGAFLLSWLPYAWFSWWNWSSRDCFNSYFRQSISGKRNTVRNCFISDN